LQGGRKIVVVVDDAALGGSVTFVGVGGEVGFGAGERAFVEVVAQQVVEREGFGEEGLFLEVLGVVGWRRSLAYASG
jgi:hypothetical protein